MRSDKKKLRNYKSKNCNKKMTAVLTNMDEPLGNAVGNALEVIEAINTLNGNGPKDFTLLCERIASELILDSGLVDNLEDAKRLFNQQIENRKGLKTLAKLVHAQNGDESYIFNPSLFKKAKYVYEIKSNVKGYVNHINALEIGNAAMMLGAGRAKLSDKIDHAVGIVLAKKVGDKVSVGDVIATIHSNIENVDNVIDMIIKAYLINDIEVKPSLILDVIKEN